MSNPCSAYQVEIDRLEGEIAQLRENLAFAQQRARSRQ